ncbi:VOC family protein [Flavobacterium notoginsengisoli]|uniref:VOC family protein n=1 Tax=Flavobacterium notoginsengisoli TaxID=1478199 RepID=UPI00362E0FB3
MRISFWLYSSNLEKSFDFYRKVFDLDPEENLKKSKGFSVPIGIHFELKISSLEKPQNAGSIEINEANIEETYERFIKNRLPETAQSDPKKMKGGTFSGPWEYPGGMALFLKDPDNHSIFFMEW